MIIEDLIIGDAEELKSVLKLMEDTVKNNGYVLPEPEYTSDIMARSLNKEMLNEIFGHHEVTKHTNGPKGSDMVSNPQHYQSKSGLEVIDVIEAFTEGLDGIEATDTGNIIKYACRWNNKNGVEDLKKAVWYANHLIEYLERKGE